MHDFSNQNSIAHQLDKEKYKHKFYAVENKKNFILF